MRLLMATKWQISWPNWDLNQSQLETPPWELPRKRPGTGQRPQEALGFLKWTQTGNGTLTGALCQQNKGAVKIKQKPAMVGGRSTHRTLSPRRIPFQTGFNKYTHL
jgi:hypothetical protein